MGTYNNVKSIAKKAYGCLKSVWSYYTALRMQKISKRAEKLLPYYQDDISVKWLRAREKYYQNGDLTIFPKVEKSLGTDRNYHLEEIEADGIVVVYKDSEDLMARYAGKVIKMSNYRDRCRFVSEEEYRKSIVENNEVIVPVMQREDIYDFLSVVRGKGEWNQLVVPSHGILLGVMGWQYFDMFPSDRDEIIVDAGAFDGKTETEIFRWGGGKREENICV